MDTWWSDEQIETLRVGDVMPPPLMLGTNWTVEMEATYDEALTALDSAKITMRSAPR